MTPGPLLLAETVLSPLGHPANSAFPSHHPTDIGRASLKYVLKYPCTWSSVDPRYLVGLYIILLLQKTTR